MSAPTLGAPSADGLQAERTALAWTRTSFAVLANGALLMVKDLHEHTGPVRLIPVAAAVAIALTTYLIGARRQRTLRDRPLPQRITAHREVHLVGVSVLLLVLVTVFLLPV